MFDQFLYSIAYAQALIPCPDGTMADPNVGCVAPVPGTVINPQSSVLALVFKAGNVLAWAAGGLAVIFLIFGAIRYATAAGDQEQTDQAKRTMVWSVGGLVISLLAAGIVQFILNTIK